MQEKEINIRPLFPNAVTMMALAFGVSSINMSLWGNWKMAVLFIVLAGFFDFMDGKVARLLGVSSKFGAELDSLSDFVSFGVAPGFLMYMWSMDPQMRLAALMDVSMKPDAVGVYWAIVLFMAMCCAARLARFNSLLDEKQPVYWDNFFMGVPAPAGAGLAIFPLVLWLASGNEIFHNRYFAASFVIFSGIMMASKIPTLCLKHLHIGKSLASFLLIVFILFIAGMLTFTWWTLSILGTCYIISIPLSVMWFLKLKHKK